jgi:hypothetical protein
VLSGPDANAARTAAAKLTRNPYDAQYLENARGQLKDQRAKQLNAAQQQLIAQYAALEGPLAMFAPWRALKLSRLAVVALDSPALGLPAVLAPCSPKRITFSVPS